MPAAYFDVDGTLVGTNLVHPTVMYLANQSSPMDSLRRMGRAAIWAPLMAAAELRDRRLFNEMLFSHYKGMSEDRMVLLSEEVFDSVIRPRIFRGTVDLIEKCKAAGYRIVLVTGSLDVTVAPLARYLGADHAITNRLEMKDGYATGKLLRPVVAGPTKARILADDARENGDDLAHFGHHCLTLRLGDTAHQTVRGDQMPCSAVVHHYRGTGHIPEKSARSAGVVKVDMADD